MLTWLKDRKGISILVHITAWVMILTLPSILTEDGRMRLTVFYLTFVPVACLAIVFYGNYFIFIPRFLFTRKLLFFILANAVLYTAMVFILESTKGMIVDMPPRNEGASPMLGMLFGFFLFTSLSVAIRTTLQWYQSEEVRKELQNENLTSELLNLKNQLSPHFFFNTLNNIYGLVMQEPTKAQDALHKLSKLMRYLLYESNAIRVPLENEVNFVKSYIDLMKLRTASNVNIECDLPRDVKGATIAPLLFISLIENAFKHGISSQQSSSITIKMGLDSKNDLNFIVRNTSFPKDDRDRSGSGIGIDNLKKRLNLLYPQAFEFFTKEEGGFYQCNLRLQL